MKSKRNLFMSAALICGFMSIAFQFDENNFYWMWEDEIQVPIILGIFTLVFIKFRRFILFSVFIQVW